MKDASTLVNEHHKARVLCWEHASLKPPPQLLLVNVNKWLKLTSEMEVVFPVPPIGLSHMCIITTYPLPNGQVFPLLPLPASGPFKVP